MLVNFISKREEQVLKYISLKTYRQYCGLFTSPRTGYDVSNSHSWVSDNDCFTGFNENRFYSMMEKYKPYAETCKFIVCPDSIQNHKETTELFRLWADRIKSYGYPVAYVLQDGATINNIPWGYFDVVFIGGSNKYKFSEHCENIIKIASAKNIWIHQGRVSSERRIKFSHGLGVRSYDGTHYIYEPQNIAKHIPHQKNRQLLLF